MMLPDIRLSIEVDVSMTPAQVHAAFARCLLQPGDASLILCHASHSMEVEGLPSCCPIFAEAQPNDPFEPYYMIHGFSAGPKPVLSGLERIKLLQNCDIIGVVGFEVDMISETVTFDYISPRDGEGDAAVLKGDDA